MGLLSSLKTIIARLGNTTGVDHDDDVDVPRDKTLDGPRSGRDFEIIEERLPEHFINGPKRW